jgi:ABC-2 type transport system permease protein
VSATGLGGELDATPAPVPEHFAPARSPFSWLLQREVVRYTRIWYYSVLGQISTPLLMLLVFGFALDHQVKGTGAVTYTQFILPGLIGQTLMTVGYINGTTSLFDARRDHYINDVLSSPLRWWEMNLACVLAAVIRGILTCGLVAAIAMPIVGATIDRPLILLAGLPAALVVAAQLGVIAGVHIRTMDQNISLQTLAVQPLTFLGGTFYSVSSLPPFWRALSHVNPVFYVVQVIRIGFIGHADLSVGVGLAVLWGLAIVLTAWSLQLFWSGRRLKD